MGSRQKIFEDYAAQLARDGVAVQERFELLLVNFAGQQYVWGGSTADGSDCSGSVCCTLNAVFGTHKRTTANKLYYTYFTRPYSSHGISAVFFINKQGRAVHVAGSMGRGEFMNVSRAEPDGKADIRELYELERMYRSFTMELRTLDEEAWNHED